MTPLKAFLVGLWIGGFFMWVIFAVLILGKTRKALNKIADDLKAIRLGGEKK